MYKRLGQGIMHQPLPINDGSRSGIKQRVHVPHVERKGVRNHREISGQLDRSVWRSIFPIGYTKRSFTNRDNGDGIGERVSVSVNVVVRPRLPSLDRSIDRSLPSGHLPIACSIDRYSVPLQEMPPFSRWKTTFFGMSHYYVNGSYKWAAVWDSGLPGH